MHLDLWILAVAGLWLTASTFFPKHNLRDWRQKALALLGVSFMLLAGWSLLGYADPVLRRLRCFNFFRGWFAGLAVGIFICLWLEGLMNVFKRVTRTPKPDPEHLASANPG